MLVQRLTFSDGNETVLLLYESPHRRLQSMSTTEKMQGGQCSFSVQCLDPRSILGQLPARPMRLPLHNWHHQNVKFKTVIKKRSKQEGIIPPNQTPTASNRDNERRK